MFSRFSHQNRKNPVRIGNAERKPERLHTKCGIAAEGPAVRYITSGVMNSAIDPFCRMCPTQLMYQWPSTP